MNRKTWQSCSLYLGAFLLFGVTSHAAVITTTGDLFLLFRTTDGSSGKDLYVDLGTASDIAALPPGVYNFNAGGYPAANFGLSAGDLINVFGDGVNASSWNNLSSLVWSVAGSSAGNTLYTTSPTGTLNRQLGGSQSVLSTTFDGYRAQANGGANTSGTLNSTTVSSANGAGYTWKISNGNPGTWLNDYNISGTLSSGWGTGNVEAGVVSSGNSTLNFFKLAPGAKAAQLPVGTFSLGSDGSFTYTVIPEPSAAVLLAAGLSVLAFRRKPVRLGAWLGPEGDERKSAA